jgi:hypothetical protein
VADIVGWHVAKKGDRCGTGAGPAGVREHFLAYAPKIALGLGLRHDWGSQYIAHQFAGELAWLGIRTFKEECLYLHDFDTLEGARQVIGASIERYNRAWLIERYGHRTPAERPPAACFRRLDYAALVSEKPGALQLEVVRQLLGPNGVQSPPSATSGRGLETAGQTNSRCVTSQAG